MMVFKKSAIPEPSVGLVINEPSEFVPDQSISLKEILRRFVRQEPLEVGFRGVYGSSGAIDPESDSPFNIDQEKAKSWDLTEKAEFRDLVMEANEEYQKAEKAKADLMSAAKAAKEKADFEKKVRIEARKYAKSHPGNPGSI